MLDSTQIGRLSIVPEGTISGQDDCPLTFTMDLFNSDFHAMILHCVLGSEFSAEGILINASGIPHLVDI